MKTAREVLKRLETMTEDGWWAFRNPKIKSSVPDMYRPSGGSYVVVKIDEWSQHCTIEEVVMILEHWLAIGTLDVPVGLDMIPQWVLNVVHRTSLTLRAERRAREEEDYPVEAGSVEDLLKGV